MPEFQFYISFWILILGFSIGFLLFKFRLGVTPQASEFLTLIQ